LSARRSLFPTIIPAIMPQENRKQTLLRLLTECGKDKYWQPSWPLLSGWSSHCVSWWLTKTKLELPPYLPCFSFRLHKHPSPSLMAWVSSHLLFGSPTTSSPPPAPAPQCRKRHQWERQLGTWKRFLCPLSLVLKYIWRAFCSS
jgi:hypothetical protein